MKTIEERILIFALISSFALSFVGYFLIRGALHSFDNYVSYIMFAIGASTILLFIFEIYRKLKYFYNQNNFSPADSAKYAEFF